MQADSVFKQSCDSEEMYKMSHFCSALIIAISIFFLLELEENAVLN